MISRLRTRPVPIFPVRTVTRITTSPLCVRISKTSTRANQESLYVGLLFFFIKRAISFFFLARQAFYVWNICGWFLWFGFCSIFMNPVLILAYCSFFILSFMSGPNSSYLFASNGLIYFWFYSRYVIFCFGKWAKARIYPSVVSFCFHLCLRVLQKLLPSWSNPMNIAIWLAFGNPQRGLIRC